MSRKQKRYPQTSATRWLKKAKVPFDEFEYEYIEHGGTQASANALGVDHHRIIKTLVFETSAHDPFVVLMHGDWRVSSKKVRKFLGVKGVAPCPIDVAEKLSGYQVGGCSPFGLKRSMPIYAEASIRELDWLWCNGGRRGYLVRVQPAAFDAVGAEWIDAGDPTD